MIYERILKIKKNKGTVCLSFDWITVNDRITNINIIENFNESLEGYYSIDKIIFENKNYFIWNILDIIVLYTIKNINYNYFIIDDLRENYIIFNKNILNDFILKYINIDKYRFIYNEILYYWVENYYIKNIVLFDNTLFKKIKTKLKKNNEIIYINKDSNIFKIVKINHLVNNDKHILLFDNKHLYKSNIKISIKKISNYINNYWLLNYIYSYMVQDQYVDIFLLNPSDISNLKENPIIIKWMDKNKNLSVIKWFSEWIERYSSIELNKDKFIKLKTNYFNILKHKHIISKYFWINQIDIYENKILWFPVYEIEKIDNNMVCINKNNPIIIPNNFLLFSTKYSNACNYFWNSNWISTHTNYYEAFINSYYEIVERDALLLTYYQKLSPYSIRIDNAYYSSYLEKLTEKYNYSFNFFDISYWSQINIILCIWINIEKKIPYLFAWSASDINFSKAFEKALNEVLYLVDISKKNNYESLIKKEENRLKKLEIYTTKDHIFYYALPDSYIDIKFLFLNKKFVNFSEKTDFKKIDLIKNINKENFYISNLTTTFWKKIWFFTIKLISDKYIPMWFWKQENLPIEKIVKRFNYLKDYLLKNNIFNKKQFDKYYSEEKSFLHFLW